MIRKQLYFAISILVTLGVFYYLLKFVSLADLKQLIFEMDKSALVAFLMLSFLMSGYRTWRYQLLLTTTGESAPTFTVFLIVLVRNFFSDLLPARLGTAIYIYLINQRAKVPLAPATASFAYAFIFDLIAIVPLILLALLFVGKEELPVGILAGMGVALGVTFLIAVWSLPKVLSWFTNWAHKRDSCHTPQWQSTLFQFLIEIEQNVADTHKSGIYGKLLALSVMVRVCKYGALYVFLLGLLAPQGIGMSELPLSSVFLGICAAEFSASLPISGIGGFGLYEGTWTLVFRLLGFPLDLAALTAVSHHLFTQVFGYTLGAGALMTLLLPIRWNFRFSLPRPLPFPVAFLLALGVTVTLPSLVFQASSTPAKQLKVESIDPGKGIAIPELQKSLEGRIVFDSNRTGSFGIFAINPRNGEIQVLVDSEIHEMFPDPSPDGRYIVFARTRSLQRQAPADIWILDLESGDARLLVENGTFPSFDSKGERVFYERNRKKIFSYNLKSKTEELVFPKDKKSFGGKQVVKPRISPDGKFAAFTSDRKGKWNAWYADLTSGEAHHISNGCEPAWFHDKQKLAFINISEAKSGSGVFRFTQNKKEIAPLHDAGSPMGHEYFPTLSKDDQHLLFSACPDEQHSHNTAEYQIFVRDLQSDTLHQLTNDSFTNRWPKLLRGNLCQKKICGRIKS